MEIKKSILFVLIMLSFFLIVACTSESQPEPEEAMGEGESETNKEEGNQEEEVEIRFGWWGGEARHEKHNAIIDKFEEKYPHITVKREFGDWADYWDRLATQTAGGNAIDVISMHQFQVSNYASRGSLLDLSEYVDSGVINLEHFPEPVVQSGTIDDEIVMIAQGNTMTGTTYNSGMFDELGIDYPDMNWTWDDFVNKAIELNDALNSDEHWGAADSSNSFTGFQYFARQRGNDIFTEEGTIGFDEEDMIDWLTMWQQLRDAEAVPDAATATEFEGGQENSLLGNNRIAMMLSPSNQKKIYQIYADGELREVRVPTLEGGKDGEFIEGAYLSVSATSAHPQEAAMFIEFWINAEEAVDIFGIEQGILGSTEMNEYVRPQLAPEAQAEMDFTSLAIEHATPTPVRPATGAQVETAFGDAADSVSYGQSSIEKAVDNFFSEAERIENAN